MPARPLPGPCGTWCGAYLLSHLASIDPEEFFVFTQVRPSVRLTAEGIRAIRWPRSEFYTWQPSEGQPGLLLFRGMEPNRMWRTYAKLAP